MIQNRKGTINLIFTALFASIIVVATLISIPMPSGVAITLQTLAIALCGYMLGIKYGTAAVVVYIALGAVGLPVFTGFGAGIGKILGVTGGFMWGFIPMAILCSLGLKFEKKWIQAAFGILGLLCCHAIGILQFSVVTGNSIISAALIASVPYLVKDIISVVGALALSQVLCLALKRSGLTKI